MAVHEGHVVDLDGTAQVGAKYYALAASGDSREPHQSDEDVANRSLVTEHLSTASEPAAPASRSASRTAADLALKNANLPWYRGVTYADIRDITPTLIILLGGLLIMIFVIPYAFSSVIKQLTAEHEWDTHEEAPADGHTDGHTDGHATTPKNASQAER